MRQYQAIGIRDGHRARPRAAEMAARLGLTEQPRKPAVWAPLFVYAAIGVVAGIVAVVLT